MGAVTYFCQGTDDVVFLLNLNQGAAIFTTHAQIQILRVYSAKTRTATVRKVGIVTV